MYKVTTKNASIMFLELENVLHWIDLEKEKLFIDGSFIKICFVEDFDV